MLDPEIDNLVSGIEQSPEPLILFLGRIHPKKGIDLLISAFAKAALGTRWRLAIAGPDEMPHYLAELRRIANDIDTDVQIDFIGPLYGEEKFRWIKRAWIMAVPSLSEVIGMVNLEAAACGTPTITTVDTGLYDWEEGGGMLIDPTIDSLVHALKRAAAWNREEREQQGRRSRQLVTQRYSLEEIGKRWADLYAELAQRSDNRNSPPISGS